MKKLLILLLMVLYSCVKPTKPFLITSKGFFMENNTCEYTYISIYGNGFAWVFRDYAGKYNVGDTIK